jgi:2-C-methyl-D-erythritol 2,4-cyclodiphosphate synthase
MINFRVGHGYDVHRLVKGRKLILCGTQIEYEFGLDGHSDADVAAHALMDAMLGAAGLGDIGKHFPDTDDKYKDISSIKLLIRVKDLVKDKGYKISNADITVIAQMPKLAPYIGEMRNNIAKALEVSEDDVNIKATTEEKLGFTGRIEGMSAHAVVLLERITD